MVVVIAVYELGTVSRISGSQRKRNGGDRIKLVLSSCLWTAELGQPLDDYLQDHFPRDLVRVLRLPHRQGLIGARQSGVQQCTGDVLVFFDSHMEVNIDW